MNISADVSAKITRLGVDEGDWVEKGTFLVELDRERYVAQVESQEASLSATLAQANLARENMIKAEKNYERSRQLFEKNLESQAMLDTVYAQAEVEKARYQAALDQAEQARAALRQSRDALAKTTIYAPMAGTISKLNKEVGEIALGSQFQEDVIMEVANLQGMEALVDVDENDIVLVSVGDEASIEVDALPNIKFKGEVTEIANSAKVSGQGSTDQKTEFEVKIAIIDPGTELRPGMTASADVVTDVREDCLGVPIRAVTVRTLGELGVKADAADEAAEAGSRASSPTTTASSRSSGWWTAARCPPARWTPGFSRRPRLKSRPGSKRGNRWWWGAIAPSAVTSETEPRCGQAPPHSIGGRDSLWHSS